MHGEYEVGREEEVGVVDSVRGVDELVGDLLEALADVVGGGGGVGGGGEEGAEVGGGARERSHVSLRSERQMR